MPIDRAPRADADPRYRVGRMTAVIQPEKDQVVTFERRDFGVYGVRHRVNCAPVDDVCCTKLSTVPTAEFSAEEIS